MSLVSTASIKDTPTRLAIQKLANKLDQDQSPAFAGLTLSKDDASSSSVTDLLTLEHTTSGTPAAGIGTGFVFKVEDLGGSEEQASIDVLLTTVTNGSEDADMVFNVNKAGTITEIMRIDSSAGALDISGDLVISGILTLTNSGLHLLDTNASHDLIIKPGSDLTADRILTLTTGDAARTVTLTGNPTLADWFDQSVKTTAAPGFASGVTIGNLTLADGSITDSGGTIDCNDEHITTTGDLTSANTWLKQTGADVEHAFYDGASKMGSIKYRGSLAAGNRFWGFTNHLAAYLSFVSQSGDLRFYLQTGENTAQIEFGTQDSGGTIYNRATVSNYADRATFQISPEASFPTDLLVGMSTGVANQATDVTIQDYIASGSTQTSLTLRNRRGASTGRMALEWDNTAGDFAIARIYSEVGSGYTNSKFYIDVADSSKVLQTRLVIDVAGNIGIGETAPETFAEWTNTAPYLTIHNSTHEDSSSGRESRLNFKGEQSGGEETTLVRIEVCHDGAADDEKGKIIISTNAGSDSDTPTDRMSIDSAGKLTVVNQSIFGDKVAFTQTDGNEYIDSLADGYMDYGATTAHRFDNIVIVGAGTKHDGYVTRDVAEVQTTDATQTALDSITLSDENTYHIEAMVTGVKSDGSQRASYLLAATVYRTGGGGATIQGQTAVHSAESDATWDATFIVNGNDAGVAVTGVAATTIEWGCTMSFINMSN